MLKRYFVKSYRNLKETVVAIEGKRSVVVWGENNQGKTNFLESLFTVINGFSPLQSDRNLLINKDSDEGVVGVEFQSEGGDESVSTVNQLYVKLQRNGSRYITFNRQTMRSFLPIKKWIECYFLSADVIRLFQDSPEGRRKVLDECCCVYADTYRHTLKKYMGVLRQKNKGLKSGASLAVITTLNQQLAPYAQQLVTIRHSIIELLIPILTQFLSDYLTIDVDNVKIKYCHKKQFNGELSQYSDWIYTQLQDQFDKECCIGYSLIGPHRDDFEIYINDQLLFTDYSRGINRIVAIGFNWAMIELKRQFFNTILLLDDVFAELDDMHKQRLIAGMAAKVQLVYATVMESDYRFFDNPLVYQVQQGALL